MNGLNMSEPVLDIECEENILRITLLRGDYGNTFGRRLADELTRALDVALNMNPAVIVLSSTGRFFCTGGNLSEFAEAEDPTEFTSDLARQLAHIVQRLNAMPAIVVAVVRGAAAGAGISLAAAADIVLATESASFTFAYTKAGLSPDGGATLLSKSVGLHRLLAWALLNPALSAQQAHAHGLVAEVIPEENLESRVEEVLRTLSNGSRAANAATKRLIRNSMSTPEQQWQDEAQTIGVLAGAEDGREGIAAFLAKRVPRFPSTRTSPAANENSQ